RLRCSQRRPRSARDCVDRHDGRQRDHSGSRKRTGSHGSARQCAEALQPEVMRRLLIRPGAIGDVILSLPALEAARVEYTEVWAPRPVLTLIRFADRTRAIADTGLDLVGVLDDARVPALETFDSIFSWYGSNWP